MSSFLNKAYTARDAGETRALYDDWAASYEADITAQGYATPARCAAALRKYVQDTDVPVLDFGCGTGLSGQALRDAGFDVIDGVDLSSEMLALAQDKAIYRSLTRIKGGKTLPFADGTYSLIAAVGAIGSGAAPAGMLHTLMRKLPKGGVFAERSRLERPRLRGHLVRMDRLRCRPPADARGRAAPARNQLERHHICD